MFEDTTSDVLAGYGGSVDLAGYGGSVDPEPLPEPDPLPAPEPLPVPKPDKCHYNQGIGNGSEGGDPGKSRPHGGSNDEGGRTPGSPSKDPLTGAKGCETLVGSKGCNSWSSKNSKSCKDPIVPDVVVLGKTRWSNSRGINSNFFNFGWSSSSKSSNSRDCRPDAPITFGVSCNPMQQSNSWGSNFSFRGWGRC